MTRRATAPLAVLAAAVALWGCSNENPRIGEEEYIANTVETLLELCGEQNGPGVYDLLAQDARRRFVSAGGVLEGCQEVVGLGDPQEIPAPDLFFRARVAGVGRRGDQAFAVVALDEQRSRLNLLDTGLEWFVDNPPRYDPVGVGDLP